MEIVTVISSSSLLRSVEVQSIKSEQFVCFTLSREWPFKYCEEPDTRSPWQLILWHRGLSRGGCCLADSGWQHECWRCAFRALIDCWHVEVEDINTGTWPSRLGDLKWDSIIWSLLLLDLDRRVTALARPKVNYTNKFQFHPLVRKNAPHQEIRNC
jgi:hypothetical protein